MKKTLSLVLALVLCLGMTVPAFAVGKVGDTTIADTKGNIITLSNPVLYTITQEDVKRLNRSSLSVYVNQEPFSEDFFNMTAAEYYDGTFFRRLDIIYAVPAGTKVALPSSLLTENSYAVEIVWKNGSGYADNYYMDMRPGFTEITLNGSDYIMLVSLTPSEGESGVLDNGGHSDFGGSTYVEPSYIAFYVPANGVTTNPFGTTSESKPATPSTPSTPSKSGFTDVAPTAYYADSVNWAVKQGITGGTTATTFSPNQTCTTAHILTFLWRAKGSPEPTSKTNPFVDVKESDYFYKAALWARENGIISRTATIFGGSKPCTRSTAVLYIWRADGFLAAKKISNFTDVARTTVYAPAVDWAVEQGITGGTTATTFSPDRTCTRAQIVTFLYRAYK